MDLILGKGLFLIAAPSLRDPYFRQTVVLLCEYGPEGALGVVVNLPTAMSISEALPQVPIIEGAGHVRYAGGPVQTNQVMLLYRGREFPARTRIMYSTESVWAATWGWWNGFSPMSAVRKPSARIWDIRDGGPVNWKTR